MSKSVWGVDVSKCSLKCVRLERTREGVIMTDLDVIEYDKPMSGEEANVDQQIREALSLFKERNRTHGTSVVCSLPGHSTFNRLIKLPPVDEAKCREIAQYEAQSQIPFPIDEVIWDYQMIQRDYAANEEREIILYAIKKDVVEQFLENIRPVDLNLEALQFAPVALYNFLVQDQEIGSACVAMDIGADNTDLIIIDGLKLWIRNLPITGNDFSKAIQKAFNVSFADAERIKVSAVQSQNAPKIYAALQPVMKDLVGEIHRSLGYYKSIAKTVKFDKIILMGNATKTIHFQKFISQSLQLQAVPLSQLNSIGLANGVDQKLLQRYLPTLGGALGLALQGLEQAPNRINLLPPRFAKERKISRKKPVVAAILACLALWLGVVTLNTQAQIQKIKESLEKGTNPNKFYKDNLDRYKGFMTEYEKLNDKLNFLSRVTPDRDAVIKVLNKLNDVLKDNDLPPTGEPWNETNEETIEKTNKPVIEDIEFHEVNPFDPSKRALQVTMNVVIRSLGIEKDLPFIRKRIFKPVADRFMIQENNDNRPSPWPEPTFTLTKGSQKITFSRWKIKWVIPLKP